MIKSVAEFMRLGGQVVPDDVDFAISSAELSQFVSRILEEVQETLNALTVRGDDAEIIDTDVDFVEALDGFIDTAYVALTGAIRLAGEANAQRAWDAVVDANLSKVDGRFGEPIIDSSGKIRKPEGWVAPDIEEIIWGGGE